MVEFTIKRAPAFYPEGLGMFLVSFLGKQWDWSIGQHSIAVSKPLELDEAQELATRLRMAGYNIGEVRVGCLVIPD